MESHRPLGRTVDADEVGAASLDCQAARAALAAAGASSGRAEQRTRPPRWYVPCLAVLVFAMFAAQALPVFASLVVILAGVGGGGLLLVAYRRSTRVNPWCLATPRRLWPAITAVTAAGVALSFGSLALSVWTGQEWWCMVAGLGGVALVLLLAYITDPSRLAEPPPSPTAKIGTTEVAV